MTEQGLASVRGAGRSVVSYRIGGKEYPLKTVPRCHTCMSPLRFEIEQALVGGRTFSKIQAEIQMLLPESEQAPSIRSMQEHYSKGHMPLEVTETRTLIEQRAREVGKSIEDANESLVDGLTLARQVVLQTFGDIASGTLKPGVRDGLAAAKMLAEMGEFDGSTVDQQSYVEAFMAYHETAERVMGPEAFAAFGDALADHPVLKALAAKYDGEEPEQHEVVRGEVEDPG